MSSGSGRELTNEALWADLNVFSYAKFGRVGITKMLNVHDEDEGMARWGGAVRGVLKGLGELLPVSRMGAARFTVAEGVSLQFGIHDVVIDLEERRVVRTMRSFDPAAAAIATVGSARWGGDWDVLLASNQTARHVVVRDIPFPDEGDLLWVAQNPSGPAPWIVGATEEIARRAGRSEDLGFGRIAALFRQMEEERS